MKSINKSVTISEWTVKNPLQMIGELSGICYGADTSDPKKNVKRAWNCIHDMHERTEEFPDIYFVIEGYSAKVMREFYTHIGGMPTRLQESTRYVDYTKPEVMQVITPMTIAADDGARAIFNETVDFVQESMRQLKDLGIPKEDFTYLLPMGGRTKVICKMNLRAFIHMVQTRSCSRALWEYRQLITAAIKELKEYSPEWKQIIEQSGLFVPKCEVMGYCPESHGCGRVPQRESHHV